MWKINSLKAFMLKYINQLRDLLIIMMFIIAKKLGAPGVGFMNDLTGMENLVFSFALMSGNLPTQENIASPP